MILYARSSNYYDNVYIYYLEAYLVKKMCAYLFTFIFTLTWSVDWPQSLMSFFFSKTDDLSKIAIYKPSMSIFYINSIFFSPDLF